MSKAYFDLQNLPIDLTFFYSDIIFTTLLSFTLGKLYEYFGTSVSNRKTLANNFVLLSLTTMLIISIIKSSVALSLGLVGALSIVRFRAAIKEPEELSFLFLAIAIGLGFGAGQGQITILAFMAIGLVIIFRGLLKIRQHFETLYLNIGCEGHQRPTIDTILNTLKGSCVNIHLKRLDETNAATEILLSVTVKSTADLKKAVEALKILHQDLKISFLDNKGLFV